VPDWAQGTYTVDPSGEIATEAGLPHTEGIVVTILFVKVEMTPTLFEIFSAT